MKSEKNKIKLFFLLAFSIGLFLLFSVPVVQAATYDWTGATSTAWATTTNWSPNGNPGSAAGDVVRIGVVTYASANQPTLSVVPANALASLTLGTAKNSTLTISAVISPIFTGLVTIGAGSTWTESAAATPIFRGGITNSGTFTASTGVHTFNTNSQALTGTFVIPRVTVTGAAVTLTNNNSLTVATALADTGKLSNAAAGTLALSGTCSVATLTNNGIVNRSGTGTTTSATVTNNLTFNMSGTGAVTAFTNAATGTLNLSNTTVPTFTTLTVSASGNTVNYTAAGNQTVKDVAYSNLGISGSGTKTWTETAGRVTTGTLIIGNGPTLSVLGAFLLTIGGATTVGGGSSGTLSIGNATGVKTFTGAVTINNGGILSESVAAELAFSNDVTITGTLTENGAATVGFAGNLTNNGTYTASSGTHTFTGASKTLSGSSTISIATATFSGASCAYQNNGTFTVATALTVTSPAVLTNNGTITATASLAGTGGLTQIGSSVLNIGGTSTITTLTATAGTNTVNYTQAGLQTVLPTSYVNLGISGGGSNTKTIGAGNVTVSGTLTVAASTTFDFGTTARTLTLSGTGTTDIANSGTITMDGGPNAAHVMQIAGSSVTIGTLTTGTGSTINFNGSGSQTIPALNYNNLTISTARTGANNVTLASSGTIGVAGVFNPTATFSSGGYIITGSTVDFNGSGTQIIPAFNYYNLKGSSASSTVTRTGSLVSIDAAAASGSQSVTVPTDAEVMIVGALAFSTTDAIILSDVPLTIGGQSISFDRMDTIVATNDATAVYHKLAPPAGAQTFAWNWGATPTYGGRIYIAFYKGGNAIRTTGGESNITDGNATTGSLSSQNGDAVFAVAGADTNAVVGWTNAAELADETYNIVVASCAEAFPSGAVTITATETGGDSAAMALSAVVIQARIDGARTLANTGTIGVAGTFTPGISSYTVTGSTVDFNGGATQTVNAGFTFNNLQVRPSNNSVTSNFAAGTVTVGGDFTAGNGTNTSVVVSANANSTTLNVTGGFTISGDTTFSANGSNSTSVGGNWSNAGTLTHNSGTVVFNAGATGKTIDTGGTASGKTFYDVFFNNGSGGWTIQTNDMTVTHNLTITNIANSADSWTLASGRTLEVDGTYTITGTETAYTKWTSSTLYLKGALVGAKTQATELYGTLHIGTDNDVRMWQSSAAAYTIDSGASLYSQDHAGNDGDLYIWGDYHTQANDYWSYANDFDDGSAVTRQVDVRIDPSAKVTIDSGDVLAMVGTSSNRTTVSRQGASDGYELVCDGGTMNVQYVDFDYLDGPGGLDIKASSTVTDISNSTFENLVGTAGTDANITVVTSVIGSGNKTLSGNSFTLGAGDKNAAVTGTDVAGYWDFDATNGEADDWNNTTNANEADPGMLQWNNSGGGATLGVSCVASDGLANYTLGSQVSIEGTLTSACSVTSGGNPWSLTVYSSNLTSTNNAIVSSDVLLHTDNNPAGTYTITNPTTGIAEPTTGTNPLNPPGQTVITGNGAAGTFTNSPTIQIQNLNTLYHAENLSGTLTITVQ